MELIIVLVQLWIDIWKLRSLSKITCSGFPLQGECCESGTVAAFLSCWNIVVDIVTICIGLILLMNVQGEKFSKHFHCCFCDDIILAVKVRNRFAARECVSFDVYLSFRAGCTNLFFNVAVS